MNRKVKKIWNRINTVLIGLVILLAFALVGVRMFGYDPYVVLSGSMEPVYPTGSVIYVKDAEPSELREGDIITFFLTDNTVVTHRITEVLTENGEISFRTKGDANDMEDGSAAPANQVIGTPEASIPYLGYLVTYIQSSSGRYAVMAAGAFLLLMMILPDMIFGSDKKEKEKAE